MARRKSKSQSPGASRSSGGAPAEAARLRRYHQAVGQLLGKRAALFRDLPGALRHISDVAARSLGVERVSIWTFSPDRSKLSCREIYELSTNRHSSGPELRASEARAYVAALDEDRLIAVEDTESDPITRPFLNSYLAPLGISSTLDVPASVEGRVGGVVRHEHVGAPRAWAAEERAFARTIADFVSLALEAESQRRGEADTRTSARQQAAVSELGQLALSGMDLQTLLDRAVELVANRLGVPLCDLSELEEGGRSLRLRAGVGWDPGTIGTARAETGPKSQAGYMLATAGPVIVTDLAREKRFRPPQFLLEHGAGSGASVPIGERTAPFGVLGAYTPERRIFAQDDVHFLEGVANVLAFAIKHEQTALGGEVTAEPATLRGGQEEVALLAKLNQEVLTRIPAIVGHADLLWEPSEGPDIRDEYLETIRRHARKLLNLVHEISRSAGIELGSTPPPKTGGGQGAPAIRPSLRMEATSGRNLVQPSPPALQRKGGAESRRAAGKRSSRRAAGAPAKRSTPAAKTPGASSQGKTPSGKLASPLGDSLRGSSSKSSGKRSQRVLVAEHDSESLRLIRQSLKSEDLEIELVGDGQAAVEAALVAWRRGDPFQIVLVDSHLPVLDGTGAARRLREQGYRGPILALTPPSGQERCLSAGCDGCASKPVRPEELLATVRKYLRRERER